MCPCGPVSECELECASGPRRPVSSTVYVCVCACRSVYECVSSNRVCEVVCVCAECCGLSPIRLTLTPERLYKFVLCKTCEMRAYN